MAESADVVVAGAGPAGAAAALVAARAGLRVVLVERGPFPGSKNMYGGVIYPRVLDTLLPRWWEEVPVQRWVTRRATMVMTGTKALTVEFRGEDWDAPPYNGATAYRADFDSWLAGKAADAGAELVCSTTVTGLLRDGTGRVTGVRTDRPDGDIRASLVIAGDGVNSFLAKEAGLYEDWSVTHFTVGVKEVLALPREVLEDRFNLTGDEGLDIEILGGTQGIPGGGFLYTNLDTIAVGVVLSLAGLRDSGKRPEDIIAALKDHPAIAPLVRGGELKEYSAHTIPEGGMDGMPHLAADGMLVAGDAAHLCLASGIWLEGVNFAIGSGALAGETAIEAIGSGDTSAAALSGYRRRLENSFVLANHRKLRGAHKLILGKRAQTVYPELACGIAQRVFTVTDPQPKAGLRRWVHDERKRGGVRLRDIVKDGWVGWRTFG
ncbi:MAG: FAD-dependent monooxygenase [Streptosporangiaceae bacterium]|nr:FAD-dependent monooxygenase [Streptosporangiaceae bacterium]